jgi:hypothetical protein
LNVVVHALGAVGEGAMLAKYAAYTNMEVAMEVTHCGDKIKFEIDLTFFFSLQPSADFRTTHAQF